MILKNYSDFVNEAKSRFPQGSPEAYKQGTILANMSPEEFLKTKNCYQEDDGSWSCDGDFTMDRQPHAPIFKDGKLIVKFNTIKGFFHILQCNINSLENFPDIVGTNKPTEVRSNSFSVNDNPITSLEGMPQTIGGSISINGTDITDLKGSPRIVNGSFDIGFNDKLTSLEGGPSQVNGQLELTQLPIYNLKGAPSFVNGRMILSGNDNLTSLEGAPKQVGGNIRTLEKSMQNIPKIEKEWYLHAIEKGGYNHYFEDLLKYIIQTDNISQIGAIHWPEGFIDEHFKRSASGVKKYKL